MIFMRTYEDFKELLIKKVTASFDASVDEIYRSNRSEPSTSLVIKTGTNIGITIYAEDLYKEYAEHSTSDMEEVVDAVVKSIRNRLQEISEHPQNNARVSELVEKLQNFDEVKDIVFPVLLNMEKNAACIAKNKRVHVPCTFDPDLTICFYITQKNPLGDNPDAFGNVFINASLLEKWNVSVGTLYQVALENLSKNVTSESMMDLVIRLCPWMDEDMAAAVDAAPMYVVTNNTQHYGAAAVLNGDLMSDICQKLGVDRLCIFPCSIHEMIVAPAYGTELPDTEELYSMVEDINATAVAECDVLTTNVYTYSVNDGLQIAERC